LKFQIGLVDSGQLFYINLQSSLVRYAISEKRFSDAFKISDSLIDGDLINTTSYFTNVTGLRAYFNYLQTDVSPSLSTYVNFITNVDRRRQIHVGNSTFHQDNKVEIMLMNDVFQSIPSEQLTILFDNYKILIYNGLLDIICAESLTLNWLADLEWSHSDEYKSATRQIWKVETTDNEVAGYIKIIHKFVLASVRNAGHLVPTDQPRAMLDLLKRFIELTLIN
jgi:vitellogenic carboxypeptidase-like protein